MSGRPWSLVSSQVQGSGHKKRGTPCQDSTYCLQRNRVRVIALADGAGSAAFSHFGASAITEAIANYVAENYSDLFSVTHSEVQASIAKAIRGVLVQQATRLECSDKDLSSTFLLVAVYKDTFLALHIGDGVIGQYCRESLEVLSAPENGEYANMTWFTTTKDLEKVIRVYRGDASSISGFILMSDGVEPSLYDAKRNSLADAVINLLYMNAKVDSRQMERMLEESLESVIAARTHDDCSIAILSRTRFKNFTEYSKYRRKVAKRNRPSRIGG